ncbi:hypothetical protein [Roseococcus pinisoli]|uniref:Uncharacterized protein n=1 Tax=Roseococcus pinisoli TaxID=2835040 RepID=A0ABS5QAQ8_9PROT|nr:hypothetical protein [Roseococcus pinisoli]MBS7810518.1 hypothetical protein [Roseococcus pinisoli]
MSGHVELTPQQRIFKALTLQLVQLCGGFEAAAAIPGVRVSWQQLQNYTSMEKPLVAPVDVIAALEMVAGKPLVTAELARLSGHGLIRRVAMAVGELAGRMAKIGKECGEAFAAWAEAMADGKLTREEMVHLAHELGDIETAAVEAQGAVQKMLSDLE